MNSLSRTLLAAALVFTLTACNFEQPVFNDGFAKTDPALAGVWVADGENGDPRKNEFAVCAILDDERYLLHHPSGGKDGIYYEARPLSVRERTVLQLRILATFADGIPKPGAARFTLVWIEKQAGGLCIRALKGDGAEQLKPGALRAELENPASDWGRLFGDALVFRRLNDG